MTMRKFAEMIGFAPSTVSKAFSESREISRATKDEIFAKAKELGCFEQFFKKAERDSAVALLCPELSSEYYCEIIKLLNDAFAAEKIRTVISMTGFSLDEENSQIGYFASEQRVDGIVVIEGQSVAKKFASIPTVYLNPFSENPFADTVNIDFFSGICEAIWNFKINGHRDIAYIGEPLTEDKRQFFLQAMNTYGLSVKPEWTVVSDRRGEEAGFCEAEKLFASGYFPTAILAAYDDIALGVIRSLESHGKKVPQNCSLVGIDNSRFAADRHISLSSISGNVEELCEKTVQIMLEKIRKRNFYSVQKISLRSTLIDRGSIKKAKLN